MKKATSILFVLFFILSSAACSGTPEPEAIPIEVVVENPTTAPVEGQAPSGETQPTENPTQLPREGLTPGWYTYTNANVVRDLAIYNGVIHAATLGGMVTWRLDSGYSMRYSTEDGMLNISANAITYCEIPQARVLVGTLTGISEYDPNTGLWEKKLVFPPESRVDASKIERLYCDQENNRLLIGYKGLGVLDLASGEFAQYTMNEGLLWDSVADMAVDGGDIWVANGYKGIAKIANGQVTTFSAANGMPDERASALAFADDGTLWVGASNGLLSYNAGQWQYFSTDTPARLYSISELEISPDGKIWVATSPMGAGRLCQFDPASASCVQDYQEKEEQGIQALTLTESGAPVFATSKGVYLFENETARAFKTDDQLASNYVDSFASTADGMLLVGTDAGIHLLDPADPGQEWTTFRQSETPGLGGGWAKAIAAGADGSIWVAITNGSASLFRAGTWTSFSDIYSYDAVAVDTESRAWFGDDSKGVVVLNPDGSKAFALTTAEGLPGNNVQAIVVDLSGRVWLGTDQGLAVYEGGTLTTVFGKDSGDLPNKYIRALSVDSSGDLFIGMFTGVARYDGNAVEVLFDLTSSSYSDARLTTLTVDTAGNVWAGTDKGLLSSEGGSWKMLTTKEGLLTNYVSALHVDSLGAVWVGGGGSNFDGGGMLQIVP